MHWMLYVAMFGQLFTFFSGFVVSLTGPSYFPDSPWETRIITSAVMLVGIIGAIGVWHVL